LARHYFIVTLGIAVLAEYFAEIMCISTTPIIQEITLFQFITATMKETIRRSF